MKVKKPNVLASYHIKGGCGKTTTISSVMAHSAHVLGKYVLGVDLDTQAAMYYMFTGERIPLELATNRGRYLTRFEGGFRKPNHKNLKEKNLSVIHYPSSMFVKDRYFRPEYIWEFKDSMMVELSKADLVAFDLSTSSPTETDIEPFYQIDGLVDTFYFLIVCRPEEKEIMDGRENYDACREIMMGHGIADDKIKAVYVLNMTNIENESNDNQRREYHKINSIMKSLGFHDVDTKLPEILHDTRFSINPKNDASILKDFVILPHVPKRREGSYCLMLEHDFILQAKNTAWSGKPIEQIRPADELAVVNN